MLNTKITTKRHPFKFYLSVIFGSLFLFAVGTFLSFESIKILQNTTIAPKQYLLPIFSLVVFSLAIYMLFSYWKNTPIVTIEKDILKIGKNLFYLKDIENIELTGKMPFRFIITFPMEGTAILFKNGTEQILFDDMYSNFNEVKYFLEQTIIKKDNYIPISTTKIDEKEIRFETEENFKGNQFTSFRGLSLWLFLVFFLIMIISKPQNLKIGGFLFFIGFGTFWFLLHSWLMHYFGLTKKYLIIRNHNFIWIQKIYALSEIKEIVFETQGKQPNSMRVITNDFKSKLYPAGTLSDSTWLDMKSKLESRGIKVRNECIF